MFSNDTFEDKYDCGTKMCKKFYGINQRTLWCNQCTILSQVTKNIVRKRKPKPENQKPKEWKLCPECGKNVHNLKFHQKQAHTNEKHKCPYCDKEVNGIIYLKNHIKRTHEKLPCVQCGELIGAV